MNMPANPLPPTHQPPQAHAGHQGAVGVVRTAANPWAGFWKRVVAYLIDGLVLMIPNSAIFFVTMMPALSAMSAMENFDGDPEVLAGLASTMSSGMALYLALTTGLAIAYFTFTEGGSWKGSVGKRAMGMAVVNLQGRQIGFGTAFVRTLGKLILSGSLTIGIGFIMVAFTNRKKGLHDMIAGTYVVNKA